MSNNSQGIIIVIISRQKVITIVGNANVIQVAPRVLGIPSDNPVQTPKTPAEPSEGRPERPLSLRAPLRGKLIPSNADPRKGLNEEEQW